MLPTPSTETSISRPPDPITAADLVDLKRDLRRALQADLNAALRERRNESTSGREVWFALLGGVAMGLVALTPMYVVLFAAIL